MSEIFVRTAAGEDPLKRQQILDGAKQVFSTVGFDAASMNDVTRAAGVSKSTLYVYFRSKEELFTALIAQQRDAYFARIEKIFTDPTHPAETLRTYGTALTTMLTSAKIMRVNRTVIAVASRMPEIGMEFFAKGPQRAIALLSSYLASATAAGALKVDDPVMAAHQFNELTMAGLFRCRLFNQAIPDPTEAEIAKTVDAAVKLFMAGYGAPAASTMPARIAEAEST